MLNVNTRVHASGSHHCRTRAKWDLYPSAEQMSSHNSRQKRFSQTRNSQQLKYSQKSKFTEQNINLLADNKPFDLPFGRNELNELYPVEDPCAVWLFPYRNINLRISYMLDQDGLTAGRRRRLQNQSSYIQTTKDIINFTKRPKFVRDLVQELIPKVFENQEKFISMHWRYNEDDWFIHCDADGKKGKHRTIRDLPKRKQSRKTVLDYKSDICDFARNLTQNPDYIANALIKYLSYTSVNSIFIASPPSEEKFMEQVKSAVFTKRPDLKILSSMGIVKNHLENRWENCKDIDNEIWEISSLVDQEFCMQSEVFLNSAGSSWSLNVLTDRAVKGEKDWKKDEENTQLIKRMLKLG